MILTNKARYVGDAIAAVIAKDEIIAQKALKLIKVDYDILDAVFNTEDAIAEGAPIIHEDKPNNIIASSKIEIGDINEEFKNADYVFEGEYETSSHYSRDKWSLSIGLVTIGWTAIFIDNISSYVVVKM